MNGEMSELMGQTVYQVKLDTFEGPLDLLLHLVNQYEIDIYEVPLREITDQYLNYIHTMQELHLDVASEYLVMAATLLAIKSQMLLPKQELDDIEDEYEEDPREELIQRLIEYRKYKEASQELKEREMEANQIYTRQPADLSEYEKSIKITKSNDLTVVDLAQAFQKVLRRKKLLEPMETTVQRQEISIEERMNQVVGQLQQTNGKRKFEELFPYREKFEIVATFLALLELMKAVKVSCYQLSNFDEIMVELMEV